MRASLFAVTIAGVATLGCFAPPAIAQQDTDQRFGTVHFATSCNEVAQRRFDRAMRYQHSFWYAASKDIYEETLKADPTCAIAYWGIALGLLDNPHNATPAPNLPLGLAAIQSARAAGAKTQRERDYIEAMALMYVDYDKTPHAARVQAYAKAMEALAAKYPDDDEAQIFYAIALNVSASPADKTYANQLKGAAILEPIFLRQPQHPGVAHYLIHLYDYPAIAEKGLPAALRYSKIAPAAPHALHMPSHIFTRVGYWNDSISSNIASANAAKMAVRRSAARPGLSGLRLSATRPGQECARRSRRHGRHRDEKSGRLRCVFRACRCTGALHGGTRRLERRGGACGRAIQVSPRHGDHLFRPRARRVALRTSGRRHRGHRQAHRDARPAGGGQGCLLGADQSISSARSRSRGSSMPRANLTRRSKR